MERTRELESRLRELEPANFSEAAESDLSPGPTRTPTEASNGAEASTQQRPRSLWRRILGG